MTKSAHSDPRHDHRHLLGIDAAKFVNDFDDFLVRAKRRAIGNTSTAQMGTP
jgi:hypothetical protein